MRRPKLSILLCALVGTATTPARGQTSQMGQWQTNVMNWGKQYSHLIMLKTGKVLCISVEYDIPCETGTSRVFDPAFETLDAEVCMPANFFCGAHAQLADGTILFAGGGVDPEHSHARTAIYNPNQSGLNAWNLLGLNDNIPNPGALRYYGTATTLGDGKIVLTAGRYFHPEDCAQDQDVPVIFNPLGLPGARWVRMADPGARKVIHWYPFAFLGMDGKLFMAGGSYFGFTNTPPNPNCPNDDAIHLDTYKLSFGLQTWSLVARAPKPGCSACMYRTNKVMKGGQHLPATTAIRDAYTIDLSGSTPQWTALIQMNHPRVHFYYVPLADGKVLAVGGYDNQIGDAQYAPEWWTNPDAAPLDAVWQDLATMTDRREYHGAAVLLPDARVLVSGGEYWTGGVRHFVRTAEIFKPPYLFRADNSSADSVRPVIASAPTVIEYNTAFHVYTPDAAQIEKVALVRLGAATHSFDQDTRFLFLEFGMDTGAIKVIPPLHGWQAPPGYYMLFILKAGDRANIRFPSVGKIVKLQPPPPDEGE